MYIPVVHVFGLCAHVITIDVAGRKKTHKGGHRHFTSEDDLAREQEKARKEREWRVLIIYCPWIIGINCYQSSFNCLLGQNLPFLIQELFSHH